ncbi:MAG: hypothetical protein ABSH20_12330 [Tepidisphaeraceae bacterium]|jgi:hypothetical protein
MFNRFVDTLETRQLLSGDCALVPDAPAAGKSVVPAVLASPRLVSSSAYLGTYSGKVIVTSPPIIPSFSATLVIKSISATNVVTGTMSFPSLGYKNLPFSVKSRLDPKTGKFTIYYSKAGTTSGSGSITLTGTANTKTKLVTGNFTGHVIYHGLPVSGYGTFKFTKTA